MSSPIIPSPAEEQILEAAAAQGPGETAPDEIAGRSLTQIAWTRIRRDKLAMLSLGFIIFVVLIAVFAGVVTKTLGVSKDYPSRKEQMAVVSDETGGLPVGWTDQCAQGLRGFAPSCSGISLAHPFGVEPQTGRDIFAMLVYGSRISLLIAGVSTLLVVVIGMVLGTMAGYLGGKFDAVLGRVMDLLLSFPTLLMLLVLTPVFSSRLEKLGLAPNVARVTYMIAFFAIFSWAYLARIVRGQVISLREREFIESARSMGSGSGRIIFKELIPNLWAPILVYATLLLPSFIAFEAALSYLGVGVLPPSTTWGKMLGDSVAYFAVIPTYLFIPGTYLFLVVLAFNILGDAVRDALDPRAGRV